MSSRTSTRQGRNYGDLKIKQLQGIAWWVTDCMLRNKELDIPLSYVICKPLPVGIDLVTLSRVDQIIHNAQLEAVMFELDTKTILNVIQNAQAILMLILGLIILMVVAK